MKNPDDFGRLWKGPYPFTKDGLKQARMEIAPDAKQLDYPDEDIPLFMWPSGRFAGVYLVTMKENPVYVGVSSKSVLGRLRDHIKGGPKGNKGLAGKAGNPDYRFYCWLCDGLSARQIEAYVLNRMDWPSQNRRPEYKHLISSIAMH